MQTDPAKHRPMAAWERPVLLRMDAADAENSPGAGADRSALLGAVAPRRS